MHERPEDVTALQDLLDRSYLAAGEHLRSIHTPERRLAARDLVSRLQGMRLLVLATVGADNRPFTGPVDGVFHRGAFCFGTDPTALRWRQLQRNDAVSATHLPGEEWAVTVHGRAAPVDVGVADPDGLRACLLEVYVPRYGPEWKRFLDGGPRYLRIEASRVFAFGATAGSTGAGGRGGDEGPFA